MDWLTKTPITHRGLFNNKKGIPENSLLAFELAVKKDYPIEFDIQMLKDGCIVVFHDTLLRRMTGERGSILKNTSKQISELRLLGTNEKIPFLQDVLDLVNGKVPLIIEIKSRRKPGKFETHLFNILENYKGEFAVESFNPFSVKWFKDNAPHFLRGQLSGAIGAYRAKKFRPLIRGSLFFRMTQPNFIAYDINYLPSRKIARMRKLGYPIIGYTAKNKEQFERAMQFCDNVIFEGFEI